MPLTVDWVAKIVHIPKSDLTLSGVDPATGREVYSYDTLKFKSEVQAAQASEDGVSFPDIIQHNPEVTISGTSLAKVISVINGYQVEFEDGQYAVVLQGSNNNIADVSVVNSVSVRSANSAGLITQGSVNATVTEQDKLDIADKVWSYTRP
jgi:hypothetical protein